MLQHLSRRLRRRVRRELQWISRRLRTVQQRLRGRSASTHHPRRNSSRRRGHEPEPEISFGPDGCWAWSLLLRQGERLLGTVQSANPLVLLQLVEGVVHRYGDPPAPGAMVLRRRAGKEELPIDSRLLGSATTPTSLGQRLALLKLIEPKIEQYLQAYGDSSSVTVMTDPYGNAVSTREVLSRVYRQGRA